MHVVLMDGSYFIYRAFHALPPLSTSYGLPCNAVLNFCETLWATMRGEHFNRCTHFAVVFDHRGKNFRHDLYPEYKANRPPPHPDLAPQFGKIREAVKAFNVSAVWKPGREADDVIATYARMVEEIDDARMTIISSDKDLMQLVSDRVTMFDTMKKKRLGRAEVVAKFGVQPEKVIDVQSLIGDTTDNVPGVRSIGEKTAAALINEFGDLDTLMSRLDEVKQPARRDALRNGMQSALLSRKLVTLDRHVSELPPLFDLSLVRPDWHQLLDFLDGLEFKVLHNRIAEGIGQFA